MAKIRSRARAWANGLSYFDMHMIWCFVAFYVSPAVAALIVVIAKNVIGR